MDAAPQAAVGAGDDVFPADDFSEGDDAVGDQFRVLDEIGGVADDPRDEDFSRGQLDVARPLWLHPGGSACWDRRVASINQTVAIR